jgi:prepilin peptidase CpaA
MTISIAFAAIVAAYMATAAATDLHSRRIPNWLTVPMAVAGVAFHVLAPMGFGLGASLLGLAVGFSLLLVPYVIGGGGAGDVKLLAALGAWLGWQLVLVAFVMSIFLSAVVAVGMLVLTFAGQLFSPTAGDSASGENTSGDGSDAADSSRERYSLPFAVPAAISTTALVAWLVSNGRL